MLMPNTYSCHRSLLFSEGIQVSDNSDNAEFVFLDNHQSTVQVY